MSWRNFKREPQVIFKHKIANLSMGYPKVVVSALVKWKQRLWVVMVPLTAYMRDCTRFQIHPLSSAATKCHFPAEANPKKGLYHCAVCKSNQISDFGLCELPFSARLFSETLRAAGIEVKYVVAKIKPPGESKSQPAKPHLPSNKKEESLPKSRQVLPAKSRQVLPAKSRQLLPNKQAAPALFRPVTKNPLPGSVRRAPIQTGRKAPLATPTKKPF